MAVLLAAWPAHQATRSSGERAMVANTFTSTLTPWTDVTTVVTVQLVADNLAVATWIAHLTGWGHGEPRIETWAEVLAHALLDGLHARSTAVGSTPFDTPECNKTTGQILDPRGDPFDEAFESPARTGEANQTADTLVLVTVVMATAVFFAGVGTKLQGRGVRLVMLGAAIALFIADTLVGALRPQNVGV